MTQSISCKFTESWMLQPVDSPQLGNVATPLYSVPSKLKKNGTFGTFFGRQPTKILKIGACIFWTQFPSLEKISQYRISIFFQRCTGHIFTIEAVLRSQYRKFRRFWKFSACNVCKEDLSAVSQFLRLTTKLFAMKFRCIFCVIRLQSLQKCFGGIFTIFACKNEAVCSEVQTHFGGFHLATSQKKVLSAFSRYLHPETKVFPVKFRRILEVLCLQVLQKKFWAQFRDFCVQQRSCLPWSSDAFRNFSGCKFYRKSSGRYCTICASKNEAVCCEVQTHFGSFRLARFVKKVLGAFFRFLRPKMKLFAMKFRRILEVVALRGLWKMFWAHFHDLCVQKQSCLPCSSDAFWKFSGCKFYRKSSGRNAAIFASKNESVRREVQMHSGSSIPASFTETVLGAIPRFMCLKTNRFAVKFRGILEVLCLQVLQKKFWAQFHDLCVQQRSCLLWSSDEFRNFSGCKFYRKSSGRCSTICASKNEAVCCEVQTHFGSFRLARFVKKVLGTFSWILRPKMKLFAVKFRRILEVVALRGLWKMIWAHFHDLCVQKRSCLPWSSDAFWKFSACKVYRISSGRISTIYVLKNEAVGCEVQTHFGSFCLARFVKKGSGCIFTIYASKNEVVCREVQTHFGSSPPPRFTEKVLDKFSRFLCSKTKLFAVKFTHILQVICLQVLQKKFWVQFHNLCVQKRSCLLYSSDAFWKVSACKIERSCGHIFTIYVSRKQTFLT